MRATIQNRFRPGGQQAGQSSIEFILTMSFLVFLIVSIFELAIFIYTYSVLADAAKEGVRYAVVHGVNNASANGPSATTTGVVSSPPCVAANATTGGTVSAVTKQVRDFSGLSLHDTSTANTNFNIYVCYLDGNNNLNSQVEVAVSYVYQPLFGLNWPSVTVFANSNGRIVF